MLPFTSTKEKRFWVYTIVVLIAIFSSLFVGQPLSGLLRNEGVQAFAFILAMLLIGAGVLARGLQQRGSKNMLAVWLGITAVYLLVFVRLGLPERSHLIEYSVLALFIHSALSERYKGRYALRTAISALSATVLIGVVDESVQLLLPNRVFDPLDMLFNGLAGVMAIGASLILQWGRKKWKKSE